MMMRVSATETTVKIRGEGADQDLPRSNGHSGLREELSIIVRCRTDDSRQSMQR